MTVKFRLSYRLDEDRNRLYFIMRGDLDSQAFVDGLIRIYSSLDRPWRYNRVFDYRRSSGTPDFDELRRLSTWWAAFTCGVDYYGPVAILTTDPLDKVRAPTAYTLFPDDIREVFETEDEALDWFDNIRADEQAA